MAFVLPTLEESFEFLRALGRTLLPTRDWSPRGTGGKWARWFAGAATQLHAHIDAIKDDLLPDTAAGDALDRWGSIRGVARKGATSARKSNALSVYGTAGTAITTGLELTSRGGLRFAVNENETIPAAGFVVVDVVALDTGSQTRLTKGETLTFTAPPEGITEDAELILDLDEDGDDRESDGAYRTRILEKFASPPLGGAATDYVQWATEITGVASAYAYPLRQGLNSVDLAALHAGSGSARVLSAGEVAEVQAYVAAKKPAGATLRVLTVAPQEADVDITILPNGEARYEFDWDDTAPPTVASWTAATRTLAFNARPASISAGDRITIKPVSGGGTGQQYIVESLSGTSSVVLEEAPVPAPAVGDTVYAGGPLVDPARDAVLAHFDQLGPSNPDTRVYGPWEANLRPANLYREVQSIVGVRKSNVIVPATTIEPADNPYPNDATVYLLVPRRVLIRRGV